MHALLNVKIGKDVIEDKIARSPGISIGSLQDDTVMKQFLDTIESIVKEIESGGQ